MTLFKSLLMKTVVAYAVVVSVLLYQATTTLISKHGLTRTNPICFESSDPVGILVSGGVLEYIGDMALITDASACLVRTDGGQNDIRVRD